MTAIVAVGAGRMGRGIAQVFATAGHRVTLLDFKPRPENEAAELLKAAMEEIAGSLDLLVKLGVLDPAKRASALDRITTAALPEAVAVLGNAAIIFEGVPETLSAKQDALARLSAVAVADAVIASTTSTILVDQLADFVAGPARFLNAHWLNPAYLVPLVEVSPSDRTTPAVLERMMALLRDIGKVPVKCKASPGFIVPRIQAVAMNEAARMVEEGVASAEDIDKAIRVGFGIRYAAMGLVEFIDWGGVDILYYASRYLRDALGSDRFASPEIVAKMMDDGHTGLGAGKGFYDFAEIDPEAFRRSKLASFAALLRQLDLLPKVAD